MVHAPRNLKSSSYRYYSDQRSGLDHHFLYICHFDNCDSSTSLTKLGEILENTDDKIACAGALLSESQYLNILQERKDRFALLFQIKEIEDDSQLIEQAIRSGFEILILFHTKITPKSLEKIRDLRRAQSQEKAFKLVYLESNLYEITADTFLDFSDLVECLTISFLPKMSPLDCLLTPEEVLQRIDYRKDNLADIQTVGFLQMTLDISAREHFYSQPGPDTYLALSKEEKKWRYWFAFILKSLGLAGIFGFIFWVIKLILNPSAYNARAELKVWIQRGYHFHVKIFWGLIRIFDGKSGLRYHLNRFFWGAWSLRGTTKLFLIKIYWGTRSQWAKLYWQVRFLPGTIKHLKVKVYWGSRSLFGFVKLILVKIYWLARSIAGSSKVLLVKLYWRIRHLLIMLYWRIRHLVIIFFQMWRVRLFLRSCWSILMVILYPIFKIYWFTSYQVNKRILSPLRGKNSDDI